MAWRDLVLLHLGFLFFVLACVPTHQKRAPNLTDGCEPRYGRVVSALPSEPSLQPTPRFSCTEIGVTMPKGVFTASINVPHVPTKRGVSGRDPKGAPLRLGPPRHACGGRWA